VTAQPISGALQLAARLKELRESKFAGVRITQRALGKVLGREKTLSAPLISSWEKGAAVPTKRWVAAYATFFATSRSVEGGLFRLLRDEELDSEERAARDALHRELSKLRNEALRSADAHVLDLRRALGGSWHFADGGPVRIVNGEVPESQRNPEATPTHPTLTYGKLYSYSNVDALFELHGHIRAANPRSDVRVLKDIEVKPDDLSAHLVVLGGIDWNPLTERLQNDRRLATPVRQKSTGKDPAKAYFEVKSGDDVFVYRPELSDDRELLSDVGHFLRTPSPYNRRRTLTLCNGLFSLGTYGVVRTLTDARFRDRNEEFLRDRFSEGNTFSVLMRIDVVQSNEVVTPDWNDPATRLHEWPEVSNL